MPTPDVFDKDGYQRDLAWLRGHYGNLNVEAASGPRFVLRRIDCTVGPATIKVRVLNPDGSPKAGQPVALTWPGIGAPKDDPNIKAIEQAYKTRLGAYGIKQPTDASGYTGFGLSEDWYYRAGEGPGIVWVLSPSIESEGLRGLAMLGGTIHEGPLFLTFQESPSGYGPANPPPGPGGDRDPAPLDAGPVVTAIAGLRDVLHGDLQALLARLGPPSQPAEGRPALALRRPLAAGVGTVSQWFGANPQDYAAYGLAGHEGLDYAVPVGTQVLAAHGGRATVWNQGAYGLHVILNDAAAGVTTVYAHLLSALVTDGQDVAAGSLIGTSGNSGRSTGPHLHFGYRVDGVRNPAYGDWVDPVAGRKLGGDA